MNILGKVISKSINHWEITALVFLIILYAVTFSTFSILRHNAFASNFDLANADQTVWNTLHGRIFTMTTSEGNNSRLGTHADFVLILLTPLYFIWNNVKILLITQSIFIALGALAVFLISQTILKSKILSLSISAIYLLNPAVEWTNIYDFHGVALAIPLLLFTFYFAYHKKWFWYSIFFLLSLITKEEISLFLSLMGLFIFIFLKSWKVGFISFLVGIIWFPLMIFIVIPQFNSNGQHWAFNKWYSPAKVDIDNGDLSDLIFLIGGSVFKSGNYYNLTLKPFGYLPIIGIPWVLMAGPEVIINVLSKNPGMQSIREHYESGIVPGLIIALIFSLFYFKLGLKKLSILGKSKWIERNRFKIIIALSILLVGNALINNYIYGPLPTSKSCWCKIYHVDQADLNFQKVLKDIPQTAIISASDEIRPHLTHRKYAYNLPTIPSSTQYIAIIDQSRVVGNFSPHKYEVSLIKKLLKDKVYQLIFQQGHFYLFKKRT